MLVLLNFALKSKNNIYMRKEIEDELTAIKQLLLLGTKMFSIWMMPVY